jgi:RNA polymerase sigma-70 factor (ECF subfamily)
VSAPSTSLVRPFVDAAPPATRATLEAIPDLDRKLWQLVAEGRAAWPQLTIDPTRVVAFVARHVEAALGDGGDELLAGLRPADIYLAAACGTGEPAALAVFERDYMREVDIALARMRIGPPRLADVQQLVRQRLFVGGGTAGQPTSVGKIAEYGGRGDLRRWVRSVAVRTCLNELRKGKREVLADDDHLIAQHAIATDDPEVEYMKRTYAGEFRAAFAIALGGLGPREQTLLRYHHVDGLNIDEIGAIYRVHRVTAFRWLDKAKDELVRGTLETLRAKLRLPAGELESVLRLIRSQIHLSLIRHLGGPSDRVEADALELDPSELEEIDADDDAGGGTAPAVPSPAAKAPRGRA